MKDAGGDIEKSGQRGMQLIPRNTGELLPQPKYYLTPEVEVIATAEEILLIIDMPGVAREWLDVLLERETLTVEGIIRMPADIGGGRRHYIAYRRQFRLESTIDRERISGGYQDGELRIRLPRRAGGAAVKIRIK